MADPPLPGSEPGRAAGPGLGERWRGGDREKTPLYSPQCLLLVSIPVQNPVDWVWDRFISLQLDIYFFYISLYIFLPFWSLFSRAGKTGGKPKKKKPKNNTTNPSGGLEPWECGREKKARNGAAERFRSSRPDRAAPGGAKQPDGGGEIRKKENYGV